MEFYCSKCEYKGDILNMGKCKRDHPNEVNKIIDKDNATQDVTTFNQITGKLMKFRDIDSGHNDTRICFNARIMSISDIMTYDIKRVLTCHKCYAEKVFTSNDYRDINSIDSIPCSCGEGTMMVDRAQTIIGNIVKVLLQETIEEAGINPRKIEAELTSKNVYVIEAGKDLDLRLMYGVYHLEKRMSI